jgi:hypothetical protein
LSALPGRGASATWEASLDICTRLPCRA